MGGGLVQHQNVRFSEANRPSAILAPRLNGQMLVRRGLTINNQTFHTLIRDGATPTEIITQIAKENGGEVKREFVPKENAYWITYIRIGNNILSNDIHFFVGESNIPMAFGENGSLQFPNADELRLMANDLVITVASVKYKFDPKYIDDFSKITPEKQHVRLSDGALQLLKSKSDESKLAKTDIESAHGGARSEKLMLTNTDVVLLDHRTNEVMAASEKFGAIGADQASSLFDFMAAGRVSFQLWQPAASSRSSVLGFGLPVSCFQQQMPPSHFPVVSTFQPSAGQPGIPFAGSFDAFQGRGGYIHVQLFDGRAEDMITITRPIGVISASRANMASLQSRASSTRGGAMMASKRFNQRQLYFNVTIASAGNSNGRLTHSSNLTTNSNQSSIPKSPIQKTNPAPISKPSSVSHDSNRKTFAGQKRLVRGKSIIMPMPILAASFITLQKKKKKYDKKSRKKSKSKTNLSILKYLRKKAKRSVSKTKKELLSNHVPKKSKKVKSMTNAYIGLFNSLGRLRANNENTNSRKRAKSAFGKAPLHDSHAHVQSKLRSIKPSRELKTTSAKSNYNKCLSSSGQCLKEQKVSRKKAAENRSVKQAKRDHLVRQKEIKNKKAKKKSTSLHPYFKAQMLGINSSNRRKNNKNN
ncbi:hypothetical protein KKD40_05770 [Candidatus Micrarchaeota archaeon]|nr:hypothetical protein [Candidatus Micrarchaeota archaeon]